MNSVHSFGLFPRAPRFLPQRIGVSGYENGVIHNVRGHTNFKWELVALQPRSQGLRGETVTKTLVKFVLSFQNFGKKIACAVRHNRIAIAVEYGCVSLRMRFFSQNFGTIKRILPGSSSLSHREGPGTKVGGPTV